RRHTRFSRDWSSDVCSSDLGWISSMVQEAEASQKRINEFLKTVPDIQNKSEEPVEIQGNIEFRNVSFVYDDTNIQALKNVSFSRSEERRVGKECILWWWPER